MLIISHKASVTAGIPRERDGADMSQHDIWPPRDVCTMRVGALRVYFQVMHRIRIPFMSL